jgi:CheY-like chemotaxis protein
MESRTFCEKNFQQVYSLHLEKVLLMQKQAKRKESFTRIQSNRLTIRVVIKEQQRGITEWRLIGMEKASHMGGRDSPALDDWKWLPADIWPVVYVGGKLNQKRILVVDDDKGVRDAMAGVLSDLGYDVAAAADGDEALVLLQDSTVGLVLTDLNMPGMDGLSLARRIKKDSSTPVVLITASDRRSVEPRLKDSVVDSVLFKPFRVEELMAVVIKAFSAIT